MSEQILSIDPVNIKALIKKMRFFSTHSDPMKKLGAALIFNNIYREIREEDSLINIFWFEILHIFVNSLSLIEDNSLEDGNTIIQINNALSHVERVLIEKSHIFKTSNDKRRVPSDISGGTLKDVAVWLLKQTGNNSSCCRRASMDLFITIAPLTSNKPVNLKTFVNEVLKTNLISNVYETSLQTCPFLERIPHTEDCSVLLKWMQNLCCALDGYNFIIKNNLCDINFTNNTTFNVVDYFLKNLQDADMAKALNLIEHKTWTFTTVDMESFKKQRCACVLSILKVFNAILLDEVLLKKSTAIWNIDFWKFILNVVFKPQQLGLDDIVTQPRYLEVLKILLNNLPRKISEDNISELVEVLSNFIEQNYSPTIDLKKNVTLLQRNILKGLFLLNSTNINKRVAVERYASGLINKIMQSFYDTLNENVLFINDLQETTFEYFILIFQLSLKNMDEFKDFINHLHRPYLVQSMEFNKEVQFGIFVLSTFAETIVPIILQHFEDFQKLSIETGNLAASVEIIMFILVCVIKNRNYGYWHENICGTLLNKWSIFEVLFNSNPDCIQLGFEYIKLFIAICKVQDLSEINNWLINLLLQELDVNSRLQIFYLLVSTVDDSTLKSR